MSANHTLSGVSGSSTQTAQHSVPTNPPPGRVQNDPASNGTVSPVSLKPNTPPFTAYLQIVSFITTITISASISASQGFATAGNFFGIALSNDNNDSATTEAIRGTKASANCLSWSAAVSSFSLMITLVLQLLLTDESFVRAVTEERGAIWQSIPRMMISFGSWIALALQGSALALIGQALKVINQRSGAMIQVNTRVNELSIQYSTDLFS
jgi:hypothetical protein